MKSNMHNCLTHLSGTNKKKRLLFADASSYLIIITSADRCQRADHDIAGVSKFIRAGRQCYRFACRNTNIGLEIRLGGHSLQLVLRQRCAVDLVVVFTDEAGIQIQPIVLAGGVDIHIRMGGIVIFIRVIVAQIRKHHTGFHIMSINNGIAIRERTAVELLNKNTAVIIGIAVTVMSQIIIVALAMLDHILDLGIGTIDITDYIRIVRNQIIKIHSNGVRIGFYRIRVIPRIVRIIVVLNGRCILLFQRLLLTGRICLLFEVADDLYGRKHQHAQ